MRSERGDPGLSAEIRESIRPISLYVEDLTLDAFDRDMLRRDATAFRLLMIGEAAIHLSDGFKARLPHLDWRGMISLRHRLAHDYGSASSLVLWTIATEDIVGLRAALEMET
ncbi:DUF86 domain-containing protein [Brevundimonas faecalis]|uniref:HepT-like ribonuclease domain-containing protein n=1 Tax=Brevundimonas faecalis TaxID=947378 RepID=UPI003614FCA6